MDKSKNSRAVQMIDDLANQETLATAVVGFRQWDLKDGQLVSIGRGYSVWEDSLVQAECNRVLHRAPDKFCECGLYAYHSLQKQWMSWLWYGDSANSPEPMNSMEPRNIVYHSNKIIGLVAGKGQTFLHSTGFRSEEMQILAIINQFDPDSKEVAKKYSVPLVSTHSELFTLLRNIGEDQITQVPTDSLAIFSMPEEVSLNSKGIPESSGDRPAAVLKNGTRLWAKDGLRHSVDNPAIEHPAKHIWFREGLRHCETGPAYVSNKRKTYYLDGKEMSYRKWKRDRRVKAHMKNK